jgi:hypothetical protein
MKININNLFSLIVSEYNIIFQHPVALVNHFNSNHVYNLLDYDLTRSKKLWKKEL